MNSKLFAYLPFMVLAVAAVIAAFHIKLYW
jgi:hypothetical protein